MSTNKRITLEQAIEDREVVLADGSGLDLKFAVLALTRSRKRQLAERFATVVELSKEDSDGLVIDPEVEDKQMKALCDVLDVVLAPAVRGEDTEPIHAGELLFGRWENEEVTEDAITDLVYRLIGEGGTGGQVADPT